MSIILFLLNAYLQTSIVHPHDAMAPLIDLDHGLSVGSTFLLRARRACWRHVGCILRPILRCGARGFATVVILVYKRCGWLRLSSSCSIDGLVPVVR